MKTFSNSRLSCYENCPWQFKLKYIDEVEVPDPFESIEIFLGQRTHEVLEKLYLDIQKGISPTLEELLRYYEEQWTSNYHAGVRFIKKNSRLEDFQQAGREAISNYFQRHQPFNHTKILATELQINFPLENYLITGFIDRLDQKSEGHYEIHDYKTSSRLPTRAACMSERQLALYHVGILDAYPDALQVDLVWHYLRFDQEIRLSKSLKELEEVKTKTLELIHTIEKDQCFSPNESALCAWCEYTPLCPSRKYHRSGGVPYRKSKAIDKSSALLQRYTRLHQSIQSQENQLFLLRDQMKKLKQEIEAYSQSNECQEFHNSEASLLLKKRKRISFPDLNENDTNILQEWLDKKQLWKELSSLDLQKIRQYMQNGQRDPEIKKKLLEYAEISEIFEFCYDDKNLKKSKKPDSN